MKVIKRRCVYRRDITHVGYAFVIRDKECYDDFCNWVKSQNDKELLDNVNAKFIALQDIVFIRDKDKQVFTFDEDYFNEIFEFID